MASCTIELSMATLRAVLLIALLALIVGCKKQSQMVGIWEAPIVVRSIPGTSRIEFREDGTYTDTVTLKGKSIVTIIDKGTWRLDTPNRLWSHIDSTELNP